MKGKSLGVVNDNYRDGFERTFCDPEKIDQDRLKAWMDHSKVRCNRCTCMIWSCGAP